MGVRFIPKTIVGQLMALLAAVLIIAQIINLALLVGSQRIQARASAFDTSVDHAVRLASQLPVDLPVDLPFFLVKERGGPRGAFFLSSENAAAQDEPSKSLKRYNEAFKRNLESNGILVLSTSVTVLERSPSSSFRPGDNELGRSSETPREFARNRPPPRRAGETRFDGPEPFGRPRPRSRDFDRSGLQEIRFSAELKDGIWFNALMPHPEIEPLRARILFATLALLTLSLAAVWIFAKQISRPLSAFSRASQRLGRGEVPELLSENGPEDIRKAAASFNTMQKRLTHMLETQRNMLRAVGHDLRTPLTSLRLRAENIPDERERSKFISTLNDMTVMTEEILSWARDASGTEDVAAVDLRSLLESLVDDYQDQGKNVSLEDFMSVTLQIRRVSIKRAIQNLVNNALQYGQSAAVAVVVSPEHISIQVVDSGHGLTDAQLEDVLKPFVRLETSRNKTTGGMGLGLSIANSIAQIHGGTLSLANHPSGGLIASITLPR